MLVLCIMRLAVLQDVGLISYYAFKILQHLPEQTAKLQIEFCHHNKDSKSHKERLGITSSATLMFVEAGSNPETEMSRRRSIFRVMSFMD